MNDSMSVPPPEQPRLTWESITTIEPAVARIITEAEAINDATWPDCSRFKRRIARLVGLGARDTHLRTSEAFDVVMHRLVEALRL